MNDLDQMPRTQDTEEAERSPERLSASALFASRLDDSSLVVDSVFKVLGEMFSRLEENNGLTGIHHGHVSKQDGWWTISLPRSGSERQELLRVKFDRGSKSGYLDAEFVCNYLSDGGGIYPSGRSRVKVPPTDASVG